MKHFTIESDNNITIYGSPIILSTGSENCCPGTCSRRLPRRWKQHDTQMRLNRNRVHNRQIVDTIQNEIKDLRWTGNRSNRRCSPRRRTMPTSASSISGSEAATFIATSSSRLRSIRLFSTLNPGAASSSLTSAITSATSGWPNSKLPDQVKTASAGRLRFRSESQCRFSGVELLSWASETGAFIIEDDYDSEFRFEGRPVPALQGPGRHGNVILLGTFNKLLFPTLRLGYAVLPPDLVDRFLAFRYGTDLHGTGLDQAVMCGFIVDGHLGRHIRRMRELYGARLAALLERGQKKLRGLLDISRIQAGLYTAGFLRNGMDSPEAEGAAALQQVETIGFHRFTLG